MITSFLGRVCIIWIACTSVMRCKNRIRENTATEILSSERVARINPPAQTAAVGTCQRTPDLQMRNVRLATGQILGLRSCLPPDDAKPEGERAAADHLSDSAFAPRTRTLPRRTAPLRFILSFPSDIVQILMFCA